MQTLSLEGLYIESWSVKWLPTKFGLKLFTPSTMNLLEPSPNLFVKKKNLNIMEIEGYPPLQCHVSPLKKQGLIKESLTTIIP